MEIGIGLVVGSSITTLIVAVYGLLTNRRTQTFRDLLLSYTQNSPASSSRNDARSVGDGKPPLLLRGLSMLLRSYDWDAKVRRELESAGASWTSTRFIVVQLAIAAVSLAGTYGWTRNIVIALAAGAVSFLLPMFWLHIKQQDRLNRFNGQLVDTLTLMSSSLRAGHSLPQTIEVVSKDTPAPMGEEMKRVLHELASGGSIDDALTSLTQRMKSYDLELMVQAILIHRSAGGNLSGILSSISQTIRQRLRVQGDLKSATAQGRLSGIVLGGLPIILLVVISLMNAGYADTLFFTRPGRILLGIAVFLEVVGFLIIRKITSITM